MRGSSSWCKILCDKVLPGLCEWEHNIPFCSSEFSIMFHESFKKKDYKDAGSGQLYTFLQILSYSGQCSKRTEGWHDRNDYVTVLSF